MLSTTFPPLFSYLCLSIMTYPKFIDYMCVKL